ncbi:ankyrin repeat-containing domain protein [Cercophora scortea]|uniref:Ankyrin repeat-containing domain protein n=1 Tax=Cercophora scortea TaxID=314031 RepID=A0AAE0IAE5_9PEZI|nr:ankyrin repeat-containing domain protein [Cercophora scortea]
MQSHLKFNIWSTFRSSQTSRSSGLLENQTRHSWSILALSISELISFRKTIDDEFENDATSLSLRRYDTPAISPTEWPQDNASRSSWRPGSAGLSLSHGTTTVAALFEPGKDIPVVVVGSWRQQRVDNYRRTRQDIPAKFTEPLPSTECWSMTLPREAVLHVGAVADSVDMMIYALSVQQLDPNSLDHQNQSALHLALDSQSISAAAYLMGYPGINLTIRNCLGKTPLHIAARHGLTKFASTILDKSPIVINFQDRQGKTALHYAVQSGTRWMVNLLLRHNADVNMQDIDGNIPLHLAIIKRDAILCDTMLEPRSGAGFSVSNLQIAWKLAIEAGAGFIMTILRAIQTKAQPLLLTNNPEPASSALAALPEMKMLQVVLAADKTSSFTAEDLDFMLKLTNTTGPSSSTALILGAGNNWGYLPDPAGTIRSALVKGAHNVAAYLLRLFPIDLDHLGEGGESALHLAVVYDAPQVVSALLLSNVNITRPDPQGYTALHLTLVHKRLSILKMLLQTPNVGVDIVYPGSSATALILATTHHFAEAVELLLACPEAIEHVNHLDNSGRAALHYAVLKQNIAIVRLLLACPRVDAALPAGDGRTALAYAALCAGKDMVQLLLDTGRFGGAGRVRDSYGKTALDWARLNTCPEVAKILREAG